MTFGQTIKKLRHDRSMTQEKLAELLSISPQAVSRWETDIAMPDISLLPPLANLFDVTTDYLLGMDTYQKDLRKAEYDEAFFEYWKHDDKEKNYRIALKASAEYPGDMEYMEWLASAEYYAAFLRADDSEYHNMLESSVKHYKIVIDSSGDSRLVDQALNGIVLALCALGRKSEAKEFAVRQEDERDRNNSLCWCLEG
ncbi:MAG: helix-turn-helix transcriptional regulator, partial [Ruminiclostridium sp.]|nr:helix-turn-helix transcriptional regulator [Ruminiclostridium sp.]